MICRLFLLTKNHLHAGIYRRWRIAPSPLGTWRAGCRRYALPGRQQIPACRWFSVNKKSLQIMQVRGKNRWCFSVILAFSKSLHESCRLFAFYRRAAHFFFFTGGLQRLAGKISWSTDHDRLDANPSSTSDFGLRTSYFGLRTSDFDLDLATS